MSFSQLGDIGRQLHRALNKRVGALYSLNAIIVVQDAALFEVAAFAKHANLVTVQALVIRTRPQDLIHHAAIHLP